MSSREDFLASLGMTEDDLGPRPAGVAPGQRPPGAAAGPAPGAGAGRAAGGDRASFLASLGMSESDVRGGGASPPQPQPTGGGGGASAQSRAAFMAQMGLSDGDLRAPDGGAPAPARPAGGSSASQEEKAAFMARMGLSDADLNGPPSSSVSPPEPTAAPAPQPSAAPRAEKSGSAGGTTLDDFWKRVSASDCKTADDLGRAPTPPAYGRRSPNGVGMTPPGEGLTAKAYVPPPQYAGRAQAQSSASYTPSHGVPPPPYTEPKFEHKVSSGNGSGAKAGRRAAEKQVPPELQREIDAAMGSSSAVLLKEVGNKCFQGQYFPAAIRLYTAAIDASPNGGSDHVLHSNRSAAYLQSTMLTGPVLALEDANKCIQIKRDWFKGHSRKGDALFKQKKYDQAAACYRTALSLDPKNDNTKASLRKCEMEIKLQADMKEYKHVQEVGTTSEAELSKRNLSMQDLHDTAAVGRSYREVELARFRDRRGDGASQSSRPASSAEDVSSYNSSPSYDAGSGGAGGANPHETFTSQQAAAYKETLMSNFRRKKDGSDPRGVSPGIAEHPDSAYSEYNNVDYRKIARREVPKDTRYATDVVGKAISADSHRTMTERKDW